MSSFAFSIEGLETLELTLESLGATTGKRLLNNAGKKALEPVLQEMKDRVRPHNRSGVLYDSLGMRARTGRFGNSVTEIDVGSFSRREGKKKPALDAYYAHFLEFGTRRHFTQRGSRRGKGGLARGAGLSVAGTKGIGYIRKSFDNNTQEVMSIFKKILGEKIDKAIKRREKIYKRGNR